MTALRGAVHLNGRLVSAARARVSVFDRGFLYGDGLFETVRTYGGVPFALAEHLERLQASCAFLGIPFPQVPWERRIGELLRRNRLRRADAWARLTLTRGVAPAGLAPPPRVTPTVLIIAGRVDAGVERLQRRGAPVVLLPFGRSGFMAEHKTLDYVAGALGKTLASHHRAFEGLYVGADGLVTEGTTSNVFAVRRGRLMTPPLGGILPGVMRRHVIALARQNGTEVVEAPLSAGALAEADEVFLTSSVVEIVPVVRVDEWPIGTGRPGPLTRALQRRLRRLVVSLPGK